ncbi:MAG: TRAP transporter large permease [Eubacterium sp.]|nr:TRAP transporter large permease [Eubacterium sp.]
MSKEMIGLIGCLILIILILLRYWIGAAMALVGFIGIWIVSGFPAACQAIATAPYTNLSVYVVSAIPMFALMGMVISETNIGRDLYQCLYKYVGKHRGGMAMATVTASGILGAITGAEDVAAVIMTKIALPQMRELNYDDELSTASIAAGSPLAIIIPPSMSFILYAMLTQSSAASLFIGGVIPGIILIIAFCFSIWLTCKRRPELGPAGPTYERAERMKSLLGLLPIIILFLLVLGSIYAGVCTTTEAGAMGAMGAIIIALVTKQMSIKRLYHILREAVKTVGIILFLIAGTYVFIRFLNASRAPQMLTEFVVNNFDSKVVVLIMVAILYVILGMVVPQMCIIMLTIPLLWPAMDAMGFNVLWFGVFVTMMQALGGVTPPIGIVAYMVAGMGGVSAGKTFRGLIPFIVSYILVIVLVCIFPSICTFLPGLMGK